MLNKLYDYIDSVFAQAPCTQQAIELKEEIRQNITEKYQDLVAQGKSEEAAYNITIASMGDIGELIGSLRGNTPAPPAADKYRRKSALLTAIAVALYILCIVPPILADGLAHDDVVGPVLMFAMIAIATGLLIYNHMTSPKYQKQQDTMVEEFREWSDQNRRDKQVFRAVSSALWALTVAVYVLISFLTQAWHITWIIFLIAAAVEGIVKAVFDLRK